MYFINNGTERVLNNKAIDAKNLKKSFKIPLLKEGVKGVFENLFNRKHEIINAVNGIDLDMEQGEIVSYIGPNGAGKSTTIKMLTGIIMPDSGELYVLEMKFKKNRNKILRQIGVMFGNRSRLFWNLPVLESYRFLKNLYEIDSASYKNNLEFLVKSLEIQDLIKKQVRTLSLGQRIRCELASILLHSPKIVFLDEPTIGLDSWAKWKIREVLKEINKELQTTILITSHDTDDIDVAGRIVLIDKGKWIFDGDKKAFTEKFGSSDLSIEVEFETNTEIKENEFYPMVSRIKSFEKNVLKFSIGHSELLFKTLREIDSITPIKDLHIVRESLDDVIRKIYAG